MHTHCKLEIANLKYQFCLSFFKFLEGKRHDSGIFADSNLLQDLEAHAYSTTGEVMSIYGDPAYPLRVQLQAPYRNPNTSEMQNFNQAMSIVRVSVECVGDITNYFRFVDF